MDYQSVLLTFACVVIATTGHFQDHTGKRFIVAFFRNLDLKNFDAYILITPTTNVTTTARIQFEQFRVSLTLTSGHVEQISLREQYEKLNKYTNIENPFLELNTSNPVTVTALVKGPESISSYLVYPLEVAGQEFRMVPFCNATTNDTCVCSIITLQENTMITLQNNNNGNISVLTELHSVGGDTSDYLSLPNNSPLSKNYRSRYIALESFDDFSGLLLKTTFDVVVFCGGTRKGATTSMEQILPVMQYGRDFNSLPIDREVMPLSKLRFVTHFNCTTVSINHKNSWLFDAGQFKDLPIENSDIYRIASNKPIGLFQIFSGINPSRSDKNKYDEGMVLVPSKEQYIPSVIIPRRKIKKDPATLPMYIGLVSQVNYTYQTYEGNKDKTTIIKDIRRESDNDGRVLKLSMTSCKTVEGSNNMSVYIYRITEGDSSFSIAGLKFNSKETVSSDFRVKPCANKVPPSPGSIATATINDFSTYDVTTDITTSLGTPITSTIKNNEQVDEEVTSLPTPQRSTCQPCQPKSVITTANAAASTTAYKTTSDSNAAASTTAFKTTSTTNAAATTTAYKTTSIRTMTEEQLKKKIKEIKKALTINKNELSSYRRKKTSANDDRSSAKGIGVLGACVICAVVSFIIILDFKTLVHQGSILWKRSVGSCKHSQSARKR